MKPPKPTSAPALNQIIEGFDKKTWLIEIKQLKREFTLEDRERFRPLLRIKNDPEIRDFTEDIEKMEKKLEINLMRERD